MGQSRLSGDLGMAASRGQDLADRDDHCPMRRLRRDSDATVSGNVSGSLPRRASFRLVRLAALDI